MRPTALFSWSSKPAIWAALLGDHPERVPDIHAAHVERQARRRGRPGNRLLGPNAAPASTTATPTSTPTDQDCMALAVARICISSNMFLYFIKL